MSSNTDPLDRTYWGLGLGTWCWIAGSLGIATLLLATYVAAPRAPTGVARGTPETERPAASQKDAISPVQTSPNTPQRKPETPQEQPRLPSVLDSPPQNPPEAPPPRLAQQTSKQDKLRRLRRFVIWAGPGIQRFGNQDGEVTGTAFSPDRSSLAATYGVLIMHPNNAVVNVPPDPSIYTEHTALWSTESGKETVRLKPATPIALPREPTFSPDGTRLATINGRDVLQLFKSDSSLRVWNAATGAETAARQPSRGIPDVPMFARLASVAFTPDGKVLTGNDHGEEHVGGGKPDLDRFSVKLYEANLKGDPVNIRTGHAAPVGEIIVTPDGKHFITASGFGVLYRGIPPQLQEDGCVRIWDLATGREVSRLEGLNGSISGIGLSPDGTQVITGGDDGRVQLWDFGTGKLVREFTAPPSRPRRFDFSPDGKRVLVATEKNVLLYDTATGREIVRVRDCRSHRMFSGQTNAAFARDPRFVFVVILDDVKNEVVVEEWELGGV